MNILITGGSGFIWDWLTNVLQDDHKIISLHQFNDSILNDYQNVDCVIRLEENINVQDSIDDPSRIFEQNVIPSVVLLNWCRKNNIHFIYLSTAMVYDTAEETTKISEGNIIKPKSPIAAYKSAVEGIALSYFYTYGLSVTVLRLFNPYGPGQEQNEGAIACMINKRKKQDKIIIYGDGLQKRDFLHVQDLAEAVSKVVGNKKAFGQVFNIGSGQDIAIKDLALLIAGSEQNIEFRKHLHPKNEIKRLVCDNSKAKDILGWIPKFTLENGIKQLMDNEQKTI